MHVHVRESPGLRQHVRVLEERPQTLRVDPRGSRSNRSNVLANLGSYGRGDPTSLSHEPVSIIGL